MDTDKIIEQYIRIISPSYFAIKIFHIFYKIVVIAYFVFAWYLIYYFIISELKWIFFLIAMAICVLSMIILNFMTAYLERIEIKKKYLLKPKLSLFNIHKFDKIITYFERELTIALNNLGIYSNEQKLSLILNLKKKYTRDIYYMVSAFSALFIPVWYHMIGKHIMNTKNSLSYMFPQYLTIILFLCLLVYIIRMAADNLKLIYYFPKKYMISKLIDLLEEIYI